MSLVLHSLIKLQTGLECFSTTSVNQSPNMFNVGNYQHCSVCNCHNYQMKRRIYRYSHNINTASSYFSTFIVHWSCRTLFVLYLFICVLLSSIYPVQWSRPHRRTNTERLWFGWWVIYSRRCSDTDWHGAWHHGVLVVSTFASQHLPAEWSGRSLNVFSNSEWVWVLSARCCPPIEQLFTVQSMLGATFHWFVGWLNVKCNWLSVERDCKPLLGV